MCLQKTIKCTFPWPDNILHLYYSSHDKIAMLYHVTLYVCSKVCPCTSTINIIKRSSNNIMNDDGCHYIILNEPK